MNSETNIAAEYSVPNKPNIVVRLWQQYRWQLLVFFAVFIPIGASQFSLSAMVIVQNDEIGTLGGAAYFAGLDWSRIVSYYPFYGFGYSIFFTHAFMLNLSPYTILLIFRLANTALLAFSGVIAYNIMTVIFGITDKRLTIITSIAASCFSMGLIYSNFIINDSMLILLNWLILYIMLLMVERIDNKKSNIVHSILLAFLMCYGMLIHTRIIFTWGGIFIFLLCYIIMKRKLLVKLIVFLPSFILFYFLSDNLLTYVQNAIWGAAADELWNTIETIGWRFTGGRLLYFLSASGLISFVRVILGQIWTLIAYTGGLVLFPIVALVYSCVCLIRKKTRLRTQTLIAENKFFFLAVIFVIVQLAAIILMTAYASFRILVRAPNLRWIMYDRYYAATAAPIIMLSVVFLHKIKQDEIRKIISVSAGLLIVLNLLYVFIVAPFIYGLRHTGPFMALTGAGASGAAIEASHILIATLFSSAIVAIVFYLAYRCKLASISILVLAFSLYIYGDVTARLHVSLSQRNVHLYEHTVTFFSDVNISPEKHPYVYSSEGRHVLASLQFHLYRHSIVLIANESGFPHLIDTAEIPIYVTSNARVGTASFNMFFGRSHKIVDFGDGVVARQVLVNTDDKALVAQIEYAGYTLSDFDTLHFDVEGLRFHSAPEGHFLAPGNLWLGIRLPAGEYELTIGGNELLADSLAEEIVLGTEGITLTNDYLTYSFTLEYSITLEEFFSLDVGWGFVEYLISNNMWYINRLEDMKLRIAERFPIRNVAAYELGVAIYFDKDNANYRGHLLGGLSVQEESGVWTSGHVSEFAFFFSSDHDEIRQSQDDFIFSFTAEPLVTPRYLPLLPGQTRMFAQQVEIIVNGEVLEVMNISGHGTYEVLIPTELITDDNRLHIMFRLPTAISPRVLGVDMNDTRVLALFFEEMRIWG